MQKSQILLLVVIGIIGIITLVKIFTQDANLKEARNELKETRVKIDNALKSTESAQQRLDELLDSISIYDQQNQALQKQRDSMVNNWVTTIKSNKVVIREIQDKQKSINKLYEKLRTESAKFE